MKKTAFILSLLTLFLSLSCKKQFETVSIEKHMEEFDSLVLKSVFQVYITQGTENKMRIEGPHKIVEKIEASFHNNTLTLQNMYKGNWLHPKNNVIKIHLTVNKLCLMKAEETCHIYSTNALTGDEIGLIMQSKLNEATLNLACTTFYYWNNFPTGGKITLSGMVNEVKIWNTALMAVDASTLHANYAIVENSSKAACQVNCTQKLSYKITGEGNIYVKGNPLEIERVAEETSSGKLILQ